MQEREVIPDQPVVVDKQADALRQAQERAERAEAELAKMKAGAGAKARVAADSASAADDASLKTPPSPNTASHRAPLAEIAEPGQPEGGEQELRKDSMMAHLLDALAEGKDIGHYGRLVFAMVARHFLPHEEVLGWLMKDRDVSQEKATLLLRQVEGKDYSPPRRDKILSYQAQQEFPILPYPDDPDCGNLYRTLKFPNEIYEHISQYQEAKLDGEG